MEEAEASEAAWRGADLEDRVARLRAEEAAWQGKAVADQSTAAALHAQLQQAAAAAHARGKAAEEEEDNVAAGGAGSCFVDPVLQVEIAPPLSPAAPAKPCRTCRQRSASVVLLPCRHLCVCAECEPDVPAAPFAAGAVAAACPMCRRSGLLLRRLRRLRRAVKAGELRRLCDVNFNSSVLGIGEVCKAIICLEIAASKFQVIFDRAEAVRMSGMSEKAYIRSFNALQNGLGVKTTLDVRELGIQFGSVRLMGLSLGRKAALTGGRINM